MPRWVDHKVKRLRSSWSTRWNPVSTKNTNISWAWWPTPAVPVTWEVEAGELLEPRRQRLWWAEITPLHSSLGNKSETLSQKRKRKYQAQTAFSQVAPNCQGIDHSSHKRTKSSREQKRTEHSSAHVQCNLDKASKDCIKKKIILSLRKLDAI